MSKSKKKVLIGSGIAAGAISVAAAVSHGVTKSWHPLQWIVLSQRSVRKQHLL